MAHVLKSAKTSVRGLTAHFERAKKSNGEYFKFSNQDIDLERTHLNYNLAPEQNQRKFIENRTAEVQCLNRKDVNVMASWVITCPQGIEIDSRDEEKFFNESYNFLSEKYGKKNIISAYVHKDETTPHMHFAFVPIVFDKQKEIEKVSAKELLTRQHLRDFHPELDEYMKEVFGRDIGILNDTTLEGNKKVVELKIENLQEKTINLEQEIEVLQELKGSLQKKTDAMQAERAYITLELQNTTNYMKVEQSQLQGQIEALKAEYNGRQLVIKGINQIENRAKKSLTGKMIIEKSDYDDLVKTASQYCDQKVVIDELIKKLKGATGKIKNLENNLKSANNALIKKERISIEQQLKKAKEQSEIDKKIRAFDKLPEEIKKELLQNNRSNSHSYER